MLKANYFEEEDLVFSAIFKALSNPNRVKILKYLSKKKSCFVDDLANQCSLTNSTIVRHLQVLFDARLINYFQINNSNSISLRRNGFEQLEKFSNYFIQDYEEIMNVENSASFRGRYLAEI